MAEIDKASLPYRAVIEFWWWLEKRNTQSCVDYMDEHDTIEAPLWMQKIGIFLERRRKAAEHRALVSLGLAQRRTK